MNMEFELRYIEIDANSVVEGYPHILRLVCVDPRYSATTVAEFKHLKSIVDSQFESSDYQFVARPSYFVAFRTKAEAMTIKLVWKPIEYTTVSGPGW